MRESSRRQKIEISVIYMLSALLIVAAGNLGMRVKEANAFEKYPNLYCEKADEIAASAQKTAYLTFDDGPSKNTVKILDILKDEGVKATFFVCAQGAAGIDEPALMRRILDEGHEIGLHSMTHDYKKIYASPDAYLKDVNELNDYILESTGYRPNIIRFPGGSGTVNASRELIAELKTEMTRRGYCWYDWDVESGDQTGEVRSAGDICQNIVEGARGKEKAIILMHDSAGPVTTPDAVRLAIPKLREQGFVFETLKRTAE